VLATASSLPFDVIDATIDSNGVVYRVVDTVLPQVSVLINTIDDVLATAVATVDDTISGTVFSMMVLNH
jgi:hypothetical protein